MTPEELFQHPDDWSPERRARASAVTGALKVRLAAIYCHPCQRCGLKYTSPALARRCKCSPLPHPNAEG